MDREVLTWVLSQGLAGCSVAERPAAQRASFTSGSSVVWEEEAEHEQFGSHFTLSLALSHPPNLSLGPEIIAKTLDNSFTIILICICSLYVYEYLPYVYICVLKRALNLLKPKL